MWFRVDVDVTGGLPAFAAPGHRYALLRSVRDSAARAGCEVLAFGFEPERRLRLFVDGDDLAAATLCRAVKVASANRARALGWPWEGEHSHRERHRGPPIDGVRWAHSVAADPLATPWTSQRDLLGYRVADFFDPAPALAVVPRALIHAGCGTGTLPSAPADLPRVDDLWWLERVAAAVHGVTPAAPAARVTFAHLASGCGNRHERVAAHLRVGPRRVRQLLAADPIALIPAAITLGDGRLAAVP